MRRTTSNVIWAGVALFASTTIAVSFAGGNDSTNILPPTRPMATPPIATTDSRDSSRYGSVRIGEAPSSTNGDSEKRLVKNQRYDRRDWVSKTANNPEVASVVRITDDPPPKLLPLNESDLIIVGRIINVAGFLSNDLGSVYSEFSISVEQILNSKLQKEAIGNKIVADREGGVVIYPNGQRVLYQDGRLGLPLVGSEYVLFLKKDHVSPNFEILTGYELKDAKVLQLDHGQPFEEFKGLRKGEFIEAVKQKLLRN